MPNLSIAVIVLTTVLASSCAAIASADDYSQRASAIKKFDFSKRVVPTMPPAEKKLRIIIDTDTANEIDDVWAVALALLAPERFDIVGFVAANYYGDHGGPGSIQKSREVLEETIAAAGRAGQYPIYDGSHPMQYALEPSPSAGVDFIVEQAMQATPDEPLWVVALGSATNLASAYLTEPKIADRVRFFWHGRTDWPNRCTNFNVNGDRFAAAALFHLPVPLVLFDTGTHLVCPPEESAAEMAPHGQFGGFLHDFRSRRKYFNQPGKGFFDLGDIAAILDPAAATWETATCPSVATDLRYEFDKPKGRILRCAHVDRDATFEMFYSRIVQDAKN